MSIEIPSSRKSYCIVAAAFSSFAFTALDAATATWTSSVDGVWSDGTNWSTSPSAPAASGDDIEFQALSSGDVESTVDSNWSVNSLTFLSDNSSYDYDIDTGLNVLSVGAGGDYQ